MTNPKPSKSRESRVLADVRRWRRQVYEASHGVHAHEQDRATRDLLRTLDLKPHSPPYGRRSSAA